MRVFLYCWAIVLAAVGAAFAQDTNFATGPQYLMNYGSPLFARPISTPSLSLSGPPLEVGATTATADLIAGAENQTTVPRDADALPVVDFFSIYYGTAPVQLIEISFRERHELPASILDAGVWEFTTAQALRERGIGVTLGEAAAYSKSRTHHADRIYTNTDIERLKN
jgi:hypothetical protein